MIQIFVATTETQEQRETDFCFVPEGEIVTLPVMTCTNEHVDGPCGCKRSMSGINTQKATTTMRVDTFDGNLFELDRMIAEAMRKAGWLKGRLGESYESRAYKISCEAAKFPVGTVVEYREGRFNKRELSS